MNDFRNSGSREALSIQIPRRRRRQDDRQARRNIMQRARKIERRNRSALMADERRVESGLHRIGLGSRRQLREADRLITESCQNLLMPQQAFVLRFEHKHGLAGTTPGHALRMLNGYRLIGRNCWKPDIKARSNSGSAPDLHSPAMLFN